MKYRSENNGSTPEAILLFSAACKSNTSRLSAALLGRGLPGTAMACEGGSSADVELVGLSNGRAEAGLARAIQHALSS
jgi:hypothetical protein